MEARGAGWRAARASSSWRHSSSLSFPVPRLCSADVLCLPGSWCARQTGLQSVAQRFPSSGSGLLHAFAWWCFCPTNIEFCPWDAGPSSVVHIHQRHGPWLETPGLTGTAGPPCLPALTGKSAERSPASLELTLAWFAAHSSAARPVIGSPLGPSWKWLPYMSSV